MKNNEIKIIQNLVKKNATRVERYELANLFSSREKWEDNKVMPYECFFNDTQQVAHSQIIIEITGIEIGIVKKY